MFHLTSDSLEKDRTQKLWRYDMKIQILGTGCAKCMKLTENAEKAAKEKGIDFEIEKVTDINKIMEFGVMFTPGIAIDGQVKSVGKILSVEEIKKML
jgi:small redox-active disulfide protein 2